MKILLLNPHADAGRKIGACLKAEGVAVLLCETGSEALKLLQLHADVDVALVHREGAVSTNGAAQDSGLQFVNRMRASPSFADLPYILTSETWNDEDFAKHQATSVGANAYLKWSEAEVQVLPLLAQVMGVEFSSSSFVLEDATTAFGGAKAGGTSSIQLAAPDLSSVSVPTAIPTGLVELHSSQMAGQTQSSFMIQDPVYAEVDLGDSPDDREAVQEMPYLFTKTEAYKTRLGLSRSSEAQFGFAQPLGNAVVPGGASQAPDTETLKKLLQLREQDVGVLSTQLKSAQDQILSLEDLLQEERGKNSEAHHLSEEQRRRIADFEKEKGQALDAMQMEMDEVRLQMKVKMDRARVLETQVRDATQELERLKERVRIDIRKIRVREKDLENRLEIMKKDSEALLIARDNKIIELKRKLDLLEFNMDLLQDQYNREKDMTAQLRERLGKASQMMRVAGGLLDSQDSESETPQKAS
ncbi:hypothetical protein WDW86_09545 [Bdellovibrionota bacterium FG-2]